MNRAASMGLLAGVLAVMPAGAQVVRPVLSFPREFASSVTIDDAGTTIYAATNTNQFGTNPDYRRQIVRWDAVSGVGTQITDFEEGVESVSVSDDGTWLAFVSRADPLGTNHDESAELFVMHPDGTGLAQLTSESFLPLGQRGIRVAVISGSANRVAFIGRVNPLGTNATYTSALFVIDRDGTNLRQLRTNVVLAQEIVSPGYWPGPGLDISDDGSKIVYMTDSREIAGINANGTGNHTFSSTTNAADVVISGNGLKIAYATGVAAGHIARARTFDGNPATIVLLGNGACPSITDDATQVYYCRDAGAGGTTAAGIWRVASTGGAQTLISPDLQLVRLSGNGNRIAARGTELLAIDNAGGSLQQLTTTTLTGGYADEVALSGDGATLFFTSEMDPLGTNPAHDEEAFALALGTGQFSQLTDAALPLMGSPSFSDAGAIFFGSQADLTGQNSCVEGQLFRLDPGGALSQLTVCGASFGGWRTHPAVRADGQVVAFFSYDPAVHIELFSINGDGTGSTQLTTDLGLNYGLSIAAYGTPTWVAYADVDASGFQHVFRVKTDGTGLQQLTTGSVSANVVGPTVSGDGNRLVWSNLANYTGQNPDLSREAFLVDAPTGIIRQLTDNDDPGGYPPAVTRDGAWVFVGDRRYDVDASASEPAAAGVADPPLQMFPDATGDRWIVEQFERLDNTGSYAFFLADMNAVPAFVVGKASPTVLSWDPSPTSFRYDVIRGSIANLSIAGSTVNLGPVSCLEDDSPDSHTRGYGDPANPAPGQAFFFLYRGSVGFDAAAGSYGEGTGGKTRVAGAGGCNS